MEQTKDYSLLRPFDLEAAEEDDKVCWYNDDLIRYTICDESNGRAIGRCKSQVGLWDTANLRMAPLAWVEGKPVYKGDVLYQYYAQDHKSRLVTISDTFTNGICNYLTFTEGGNWAMAGNVSELTWNKPKVKKSGWLNIYPNNDCSCMHSSKLAADTEKAGHREACIEVFWEV